MKNDAMAPQASPRPPAEGAADAWGAALRRFDRELRRRGAAERTRRAYWADLGELAAWATGRDLAPGDLDYQWLCRWAARVSQDCPASSTLARKLASMRAFFRAL